LKAVIYRNIKGTVEFQNLKMLMAKAHQCGLNLEKRSNTVNTETLTLYGNNQEVNLSLYRSDKQFKIFIDYLRLEPAEFSLISFIDFLISHIRSSGEKHIIHVNSLRETIIFHEGKAENHQSAFNQLEQFELLLLKESLYGHVHLDIDKLISALRAGDSDSEKRIRESLNSYKQYLNWINEQLPS
jgi:hypothetical protein